MCESEGANKGKQKLRRENRLSEKDRPEKTRTHIYTLSTQKTEHECGAYVEVEESGWYVPPLHALGKHLQGKQKARVVAREQGWWGTHRDCRIPPLSLSWNMTPLLAFCSLSSTAQQQTPTHRWGYRGQAARQRLLTLWFPLGGNASIIEDLVLKFCAQTGVIKKLHAQKRDVS